jgi:2-amino-4-hydroxy-6-hydroxymethyldihydropteridine diphosphokinase
MRRAFLALGSNLGDREGFLAGAIADIDDVVAGSSLYETDPVGGPEQGAFLNTVVELSTDAARVGRPRLVDNIGVSLQP